MTKQDRIALDVDRTDRASSSESAPRPTLSLFDSAAIIVGTIIGSGIYETPSQVAKSSGSLTAVLFVWLAGAAIALLGALCYAELAGIFPLEGGDYVYLSKAFGRRTGFLFAWCELWIVRPGNTGALAFVFAKNANQIVPLEFTSHPLIVYSATAVLGITAINILGVQLGKWTQNILTVAKVLGLLVVFGLALFGPTSGQTNVAGPAPEPNFALAMIFVMFSYGGWSDVSYVVAEIRKPRETVLRALLLGIGIVAAIYLVANVAFARALGFAGFQQLGEGATAAGEVAQLRFGERGLRLVSGLICLTTLGAINGQVFTSARVYYALGVEHSRLAWLGRWNATLGSPIWALITQLAVTLPLIFTLGLDADAFAQFVALTSPVFWFFFFLVGMSLFRFRVIGANLPRPFSTPGYPITPFLFCLASLGMLWSSVRYVISNWSAEIFWVLAIAILGVIFSCFDQRRSAPGPSR